MLLIKSLNKCHLFMSYYQILHFQCHLLILDWGKRSAIVVLSIKDFIRRSKSYKVTGFDLRDFFQKVNEGFKPQWNPDIWDYSIETRVKLAVADGVIK